MTLRYAGQTLDCCTLLEILSKTITTGKTVTIADCIEDAETVIEFLRDSSGVSVEVIKDHTYTNTGYKIVCTRD